MTSSTIGELPRPWALVIGFNADSSVAPEIQAVFPTVKFVENADQVLQTDYDVAIVRGFLSGNELAAHLNVVWFSDNGAAPLERSRTHNGSFYSLPEWVSGRRAARFDLTPAARENGLGLLATNIATWATGSSYQVVTLDKRPKNVRPFVLETGSGGALAAAFDRTTKADSEVWCLPDQACAEAGAWIRAAAKHWEQQFPDRFPHVEWRDDPTWMDPQERAASAHLITHEQETLDLARARDEERERLAAALKSAQRNSETGLLRLLTTNGTPLVEAATTALEQLGFAVTESDKERAGGPKQEDLLVNDAGWTALVEVKGYEKRNARENDLLQIEKAVRSYRQRTGGDPDRRWYLVNQSYGTPPPQRQRPLHSAQESVDTFAELDGLIIDTRDLFRLTVDAASGVISTEDARTLLKTATGVLTYPVS